MLGDCLTLLHFWRLDPNDCKITDNLYLLCPDTLEQEGDNYPVYRIYLAFISWPWERWMDHRNHKDHQKIYCTNETETKFREANKVLLSVMSDCWDQ